MVDAIMGVMQGILHSIKQQTKTAIVYYIMQLKSLHSSGDELRS